MGSRSWRFPTLFPKLLSEEKSFFSRSVLLQERPSWLRFLWGDNLGERGENCSPGSPSRDPKDPGGGRGLPNPGDASLGAGVGGRSPGSLLPGGHPRGKRELPGGWGSCPPPNAPKGSPEGPRVKCSRKGPEGASGVQPPGAAAARRGPRGRGAARRGGKRGATRSSPEGSRRRVPAAPAPRGAGPALTVAGVAGRRGLCGPGAPVRGVSAGGRGAESGAQQGFYGAPSRRQEGPRAITFG